MKITMRSYLRFLFCATLTSCIAVGFVSAAREEFQGTPTSTTRPARVESRVLEVSPAPTAAPTTSTTPTTPLAPPETTPRPKVMQAAPTTTHPCYEDEPCWDCTTMGNHICGPDGKTG